jgi:DNA (cytosine-5)-methyltransferase 1
MVADIMDDVPEDDPRWKTMEGAKAREVAQAAAGKNFRMQVVHPTDTSYGSIGKGYARVRNTEPKLAHPTDPDKLRLLTPAEHARGKGVPERLIANLPPTSAHEVLGQGIAYDPFFMIGKLFGQMIWDFAERLHSANSAKQVIQQAEASASRRVKKIVG